MATTPVCVGNKIQFNFLTTSFTNVFIEIASACIDNVLIDCASNVFYDDNNNNSLKFCQTNDFSMLSFSDLEHVNTSSIDTATKITLKNIFSSQLVNLSSAILNNCSTIVSYGGSFQMYNCSGITLGENCNSFFTNCSNVEMTNDNCLLN